MLLSKAEAYKLFTPLTYTAASAMLAPVPLPTSTTPNPHPTLSVTYQPSQASKRLDVALETTSFRLAAVTKVEMLELQETFEGGDRAAHFCLTAGVGDEVSGSVMR